MQVILNHQQIEQKITRLGHQILENSFKEKTLFIGGIIGNGSVLAKKIVEVINANSTIKIVYFEVSINKEEPWSEKIYLSIDEKLLKK